MDNDINRKTAGADDLPMEERIVMAAENLFLDRGFSMTTTTEIAREAGCNQALVHYYFRTKENLFQKIFDNKVAQFVSAFMTVENHDGPFEEKIGKIVEVQFDIMNANRKLPLFLINEVIHKPERLAALRDKLKELPDKLLSMIDRELTKEIAKGSIRQIDALSLLMNILSMNVFVFISMPIFRSILNLSDEQSEALVSSRRREAVTTIIHGLRP